MQRTLRTMSAAVIVLAFVSVDLAQTLPTEVAYPNRYPPPIPRRKGQPPPRLTFELVGEIDLPGPLPGEPLRLDEGKVRVSVRGAVAEMSLEPGSSATLREASDGAVEPDRTRGPTPWVISPDGRRRVRAHREGRIEAQRMTRRGWRRLWQLRVGVAVIGNPLVTEKRVCFAALDNQAYCVRSKNGHRLWVRDLGDRVSRPLTLWPGTGATAEGRSRRLILAVPDDGAVIVALDPFDGSRVAVYELPAEGGRFASEAVVAPDGTIGVARQGYDESKAALALLALRPPEPAPSSEDGMTYNERAPTGEPNSR